MICDSLMASSLDEVSTDYGLIAEAVSHPADFSSATFRLRAAARHHDGKPITVEDVIFSMESFKKHSPMYSAYYRHVTKIEQTGEARGDVHLRQPGQPRDAGDPRPARSACRSTGGREPTPPARSAISARPRSSRRSATAPIASRNSSPAASIVYERVKDYWAQGSQRQCRPRQFRRDAVRVFPRRRRSRSKPSRPTHVDWRTENSAKNWATAYDFPAVKEKRVILEEFPERNRGIMQAFAFNTRRDKFKDPRLRRAFNLAYDFEEMNKQMFFGQYQRIGSYFEGTELASSGLPEGRSSRSWKPCATRSRRRSSPRLTTIRSAARPRTCAPICARRRGCCARRATRCATRSSSMPRPASRSASKSSPRIRPSSASSCSTSLRSNVSASP